MSLAQRLTLRVLAFALGTVGATAALVAAGLNEPAPDAAPAPAAASSLPAPRG